MQVFALAGTKGSGLRPGALLKNVMALVPELSAFANLDLKVIYNKDSSNCGPREWKKLAVTLHNAREHYDAFLVIHGTDTMAYTASALSLMLVRTRKPVHITIQQLFLMLSVCILHCP
jgi:L-asparaginase